MNPKTASVATGPVSPAADGPGGSPALAARLREAVAQAGGWLPFERFMELALYAPGLGYYASGRQTFGMLPQGGSDFVTAPELSPLFGQALAVQVAQALQATGTNEIWEFGAGSGALARQLLMALDAAGREDLCYRIVDLSGSLAARQREALAPWVAAGRVQWLARLPEAIEGVVIGNEVLDAMPVTLIERVAGQWHERGVVSQGEGFAWARRPTALRPPVEIDGEHDYLTEIHPQAEAFAATLVEHLARGAAFFIDYGFGEAEYYHPQRSQGTLMCHQGHRAGGDPLTELGAQDITAHVNFTAVALAAQRAGEARGREVGLLGYTSQGRFLINCGLPGLMQAAPLAARANAIRLLQEHEMGELFKVIGLYLDQPWGALGFAAGDRSHRL